MEDKPTVCRLSPLGKNHGMVSGNVTYEYLPPALDCPACETNVEMKVSEHISAMVPYSEHKQQERFHEILISYHNAGTLQDFDRERFHEITKQVYNIDALLSQYGLGTEHRPQIYKLVEIIAATSNGDFSVYETFIEDLTHG